jgi:hypothetical protein
MPVAGCTQSYFHLCYRCCPCLGCAQRFGSCMGRAAAAATHQPYGWYSSTSLHVCRLSLYVSSLQLHFSHYRVHLMACAVAPCTALLGDLVWRWWQSAHHTLLLKQAAAQVSTRRIGAVVLDGSRCLCFALACAYCHALGAWAGLCTCAAAAAPGAICAMCV